jgi:hypothetical protein
MSLLDISLINLMPFGLRLRSLSRRTYLNARRSRHDVNCHSFADDNMLYRCKSASNSDAATASCISECMSDLSCLMSSHRIKLNPDKTEFMWLGTPGLLSKLPNGGAQLVLENCTIPVSMEVRSLGVIVESDLGMKHHVRSFSRSCFYHLQQLRGS